MYKEPTFFLRKNTKGNNTFDVNTYDYICISPPPKKKTNKKRIHFTTRPYVELC